MTSDMDDELPVNIELMCSEPPKCVNARRSPQGMTEALAKDYNAAFGWLP